MRSPFRRLLLSLATLLMLPAVALAGRCERLVATGVADQPPYLWSDPDRPGRLIGASADLLEELGKVLDLKIELIPAGVGSQAEAEVASGRIDLLLNAVPNAPRRQMLDFVGPAPFVLSESVWVRADRAFAYGGWNDLYGHLGAALGSDRLIRAFDVLSSAYLPQEAVPGLSEGLRQLQRGEVAYLLHETLATRVAVERLGMAGEVRAFEPPIVSEGLYLAVGRDSACNGPELRARLAAGLDELIARGVPEHLLQRNLERWKAQWLRVVPVDE